MSVFLYAMREREMIMDIFELVSGQRMMTTYIRPGGVWRDVPVEFEIAVRKFIKLLPNRIDEYTKSLSNQEPTVSRQNHGNREDQCLKPPYPIGVTGPTLRASGRGLRSAKGASVLGYDQYDFDVPTEKATRTQRIWCIFANCVNL